MCRPGIKGIAGAGDAEFLHGAVGADRGDLPGHGHDGGRTRPRHARAAPGNAGIARGIALGKLLATCAYMFLSLSLTTAALFVALGRLDLEQFGMSANLNVPTALGLIAVTAPLIPLLAALMTLVAAQARSTREAQAWLGVTQLVPTLPLVFASLMNLAPTLPTMAVPSLSQHFLITAILRAEQLDPLQVLVSVISTLLLGMLLVVIVARVYRRNHFLYSAGRRPLCRAAKRRACTS